MIISDEFCGVKVISLCLGLSRLGPWSEPSLGDLVSHAPAKVKVVKASEVWAGYAPLPDAPVLPLPVVVSHGVSVRTKVEYEFTGEGCFPLTPGKELRQLPVLEAHAGWDFSGESAEVVKPCIPADVLGWLAERGYAPHDGGTCLKVQSTRTLVVGDRHPRVLGGVVESRQVLIVLSQQQPSHPSTPSLTRGADHGDSSPIPGVWKQLRAGVWKFEEAQYVHHIRTEAEVAVGWDEGGVGRRAVETSPGFFDIREVRGCPVTELRPITVPVNTLAHTVMPYGTMRIFPRGARLANGLAMKVAQAHKLKTIGKFVDDVTSEADELGFEGKSLAQMYEEGAYKPSSRDIDGGCPKTWAEAKARLARQWRDEGEQAKGVLVPVKGVPISALKDSFLEFQLEITHGVLRQQLRQYLDSRRPAESVDDMLAEAMPGVEVAEFTRTPSGHWNDNDEYVSTGCPEGHMLGLGWRREFTQVLRCEDAYGRRLTPKKAKALAEAAERLQAKAAEKLLASVGCVLPKGHDDYDDDRPIEGPVESRNAMQMDRLSGSYQKQVEHEVLEKEAADRAEGYAVDDDYDSDPEMRDNILAWQDEYEDLARGEVAFTGHLAANDPMQVWYGALRTIDKLGRIATRARAPGEDTEEGSYPQQVKAEFDSTCQAVRESQRFLAAAGATEVKGGTLKSHLEEARKAARQAVADLESGAEAEHCRLAFLKEGLVAHPQLGKWVAKVEPKFVAGLKDSDPELWAALPAAARKVSADRKVTPAAKRKAEAAIVEWLADRKEADAIARQEPRIARSIVKAVEEAVNKHHADAARAKAKDEAKARRLAVIRQYKGVAN